ncbi:MAG TPA: DUF1858 domain-containing protein [Vicinamibacterales bacterium]|nr:DUF1858 domain-containing protein [Vicinamibacterales bacterium]HOQ59303.1 DUF1858 domain-containing protein [Vicinamibacterales bacterium]HPK70759.1 DUF1858 domain-containing protein [Vicinamibacterales bacterium]
MGAETARPPIAPETTVGSLLAHYPELEASLLALSPAYGALKNPVLRRTVAKVATLRQVAKVGNVPLPTLINRLRADAGQAPASCVDEADETALERPDWADPALVARTYDARPVIDAGGHPMPQVMRDWAGLRPGEVYELVTPFLPEPLVALAAEKGYRAWSVREGSDLVRTYFARDETRR